MQSYLQYRSLRNRLRAQLTRAKGISRNSSSESDDCPPPRSHIPPYTAETEVGDLGECPTSETLCETGTNLAAVLSGVVQKSDPHDLGPANSLSSKTFLVGFEGPQDPLNPRNWSLAKRILCTLNVGLIALVVGTAASIDSAVIPQAAADFGVSEIVEALATGLFLCGFGFGALIAGPLSETVGRNPVYFGSLALYMLFIMGAGLSSTIEAQLICRFLAGFCGESPLSTVGGSISDLWNPMNRLIAFPIFATAGLMGPITGPIIGGFIGQSPVLSWRWTEWIVLIISGALLVSLLLFQPETYEPILLKWKARHLRLLTGDKRYIAATEIEHHVRFRKRMVTALKRPFAMIIQEPTIMLWTAYLTVIYLMLFGFLDGYTYIFQQPYNLSQGITGLLFVGIALGLVLASVTLTPLIFGWAKQEIRKSQEKPHSGEAFRLPPEFFLWYAMIGAPAIPISFFWMGWTASPKISIWSPILSSVLFGCGILSVFISTYMYLIDTYEVYAASALTMITLVRYVASGGMIEISIPMYRNLGPHWALTLLGLISVVFTAVPYAFYRFGPWIRSKSKFAKAK